MNLAAGRERTPRRGRRSGRRTKRSPRLSRSLPRFHSYPRSAGARAPGAGRHGVLSPPPPRSRRPHHGIASLAPLRRAPRRAWAVMRGSPSGRAVEAAPSRRGRSGMGSKAASVSTFLPAAAPPAGDPVPPQLAQELAVLADVRDQRRRRAPAPPSAPPEVRPGADRAPAGVGGRDRRTWSRAAHLARPSPLALSASPTGVSRPGRVAFQLRGPARWPKRLGQILRRSAVKLEVHQRLPRHEEAVPAVAHGEARSTRQLPQAPDRPLPGARARLARRTASRRTAFQETPAPADRAAGRGACRRVPVPGKVGEPPPSPRPRPRARPRHAEAAAQKVGGLGRAQAVGRAHQPHAVQGVAGRFQWLTNASRRSLARRMSGQDESRAGRARAGVGLALELAERMAFSRPTGPQPVERARRRRPAAPARPRRRPEVRDDGIEDLGTPLAVRQAGQRPDAHLIARIVPPGPELPG